MRRRAYGAPHGNRCASIQILYYQAEVFYYQDDIFYYARVLGFENNVNGQLGRCFRFFKRHKNFFLWRLLLIVRTQFTTHFTTGEVLGFGNNFNGQLGRCFRYAFYLLY
jgi:hypothetical protein